MFHDVSFQFLWMAACHPSDHTRSSPRARPQPLHAPTGSIVSLRSSHAYCRCRGPRSPWLSSSHRVLGRTRAAPYLQLLRGGLKPSDSRATVTNRPMGMESARERESHRILCPSTTVYAALAGGEVCCRPDADAGFAEFVAQHTSCTT